MKLTQFVVDRYMRIRTLGLVLPGTSETSPRGYRYLAFPDTLMRCLDERMVMTIGESYRKTRPTEEHAGDLIKLLTGDDGSESERKSMGLRARRRWLKRQVRADFASGQLIEIHGWLLSRTEARQCALFSIR